MKLTKVVLRNPGYDPAHNRDKWKMDFSVKEGYVLSSDETFIHVSHPNHPVVVSFPISGEVKYVLSEPISAPAPKSIKPPPPPKKVAK